MKNDANLYAFGRLTDEICNQFRAAVYVLAIYGEIYRGATTGATTHYTDARNLRCILRSTWGAVCEQPLQEHSLVSRERPVFGSTVVLGFYHEAMVVGFFVNCCKIPISLIDRGTCNWRVAGRNDDCNGTLKSAKNETVR